MDSFATVEDIELLWRELNSDETQKAENLLPVVSDSLRYEAQKVGKNLDDMLKVDVVARALMTSTNSEPMEQMSQSALGYSVSGTFLVPGGGLFIKKSELARLGIRRQKCGVVNLYGND